MQRVLNDAYPVSLHYLYGRLHCNVKFLFNTQEVYEYGGGHSVDIPFISELVQVLIAIFGHMLSSRYITDTFPLDEIETHLSNVQILRIVRLFV